jgi:hypothetical protein
MRGTNADNEDVGLRNDLVEIFNLNFLIKMYYLINLLITFTK